MPEYIPTPTGRLFHEDKTSHIKGIVGPVGSGKSSASVIELVIRATEQKPGPDGVRRSRWAIIRNSFPQLKSTTIQTFQQWLPQSVCPIKYGSPITATFKRDLPDGTKVEAQFWFFPMDDERSMANLLSLELTGAWINEASEIAEFVPDAVFMRVGRYPAKADGEYTWSGIIFDSNPSSVKHWMYTRFVLDPAPGTVLFRQPPALTPIYDPEHPNDLARAQFEPNPEAENIENLGKGYDYYMDIVATHRHDPEYIKRFVLGEFTMGLSGHPVYPMFREHEHVSSENRLKADRSHMLLMGMDFGLSPAAVFGQFKDGRLEIYDELFEEDCSLIEFIEDHLAPFVRSEYPGFRHIIVGDPAATARSGIDKARPLQVLAQHGFTVMPATTNNLQARLDAVRWFLRRREAFKVNKRCEMLVGGFLGGYQWKEKKTALGGRQVVMVPNKDGEPGRYSHIHDACQYLANYVQNGGETIVTGRNTLFEDDLGGYRAREISLLDPYGVESGKPKSKRFLYV